jgi:phage terminase large subunit GpA-like protein
VIYELAFKDGLRPDRALTVSEWSDEHRMLSSKASAEPGHWRTERTPYLAEIMDSLSSSDPTQRVIFMKSAQIGGTEAGNNWIGYVMHHAPGPMLYVLPTVEIAEKASKQRIAPMLDESPALRELVAPARSRDSGNTLLVKEYKGGVFMMTGANSAAGLRSMPIRWLFMDEIDAYPSDVEGEGSPIALAEKRTTTFGRRKIFLVSTPTEKETSRIEAEYERSDKRRYFVPCPHCDHMQWLRWRGYNDDVNDPRAKEYRLVWTDDKRSAAYICEECGSLIEERHKTAMLNAGHWVATAEGDGLTRGYHINSLYSPAGWKSWVEILQEFELASKDPALLKTFVNTTLGEAFEEAASARLDAEGLAKRAESYELLSVPAGGVVVTAGCDVQRNRVEIVQRAWGPGEQSWLVNYAVIHGDPQRQELWDEVLNVLDMEFEHADGGKLVTYAACIDSGDGETTHAVYEFARQHKRQHILAIKGQSQPGKIILGKPTKQDINRRGQVLKKGVEVWPYGSDTAKSTIYQRLKNTEAGPGTYHWPNGLPDDYYKQLTSERQITKMVNGFPKRVWTKRDADRNEVLDCEGMALAALQYVYTRHNRTTFWTTMEARAKKVSVEPAHTPDAENIVVESAANQTTARSSGRNLLAGWSRG